MLLDADETIFDFKKSEKVSLMKALEMFSVPYTDADIQVYSGINLRFWKELEKGTVTREKLKVQRFEEFFKYMGVECDSEKFAAVYLNNLSQCSHLIDGAAKFVKKLHKHCKIYIATNGIAKTQKGRMERSSIKDDIDGMFISEEINFSKPDKRYFDFIFERLEIKDKSRVVIIGDSLTSDMQGGKNAGITTCHFSRDEKVSDSDLVDYSLNSYDDFWDILFDKQ